MLASGRSSFRFRPALVAGAAFAAALEGGGSPVVAQEGRPDRIRPVTEAELENPEQRHLFVFALPE